MKTGKFFKWIENTVGKWEKEELLVTSKFSFSIVFSKGYYCKHVKARVCFGKDHNKSRQSEHFCVTDSDYFE